MSLAFRVSRMDSVGSTNDIAKAAGRQGEEEGFAVIARAQTRGRGRMGREWSSPVGGLYLSLLLRPDLPFDAVLAMTVYCGVPVAEAIELVTGVRVGLKWPNDLEIEGKKVGGILVEGVSEKGRLEFVAVGIGINANSGPTADEAPNAISLREATGHEVDVGSLADSVLERFKTLYDRLASGELEREYARMSSVLRKRVEVETEGAVTRGVAAAFGRDGSLVVRTDDGWMVRTTSAVGTSGLRDCWTRAASSSSMPSSLIRAAPLVWTRRGFQATAS
jgi:BirA family biotin operon repressor/biotin-[acetyl-CoA-carboxylase] ligase